MMPFKSRSFKQFRCILRYNLLCFASQITQNERWGSLLGSLKKLTRQSKPLTLSALRSLVRSRVYRRVSCEQSLKSGVTFIEIMLTIFMMGMILSSAFVAQSTVLQQIGQWSRSLRSVFALRELVVHTTQDRLIGKTHPKEQQKGPIKLLYSLEKPKKESALSKFNNLYVERVEAQWAGEQEVMIALLYKPEVQKK